MPRETGDPAQAKTDQQAYVAYLKSTNSRLKSIVTQLRANADNLGNAINMLAQIENQASDSVNTSANKPSP